MSIDGTKLLFEGYLKKRKDTMKMSWATYWFRLQNTTLFFYTKKDGSALHLRGLYYIYTVQSVREVSVYGKHFVFELTMTNGKRKVLAAETAALRKAWLGHLWWAMRLSSPGSTDLGDLHMEEWTQQERGHSTHSSLNGDSATGPEYGQSYSQSNSAPTTACLCEDRDMLSSLAFPLEVNTKENTFKTAKNYQHYKGEWTNSTEGSCGGMSVEDRQKDPEESEYTSMDQIHQALEGAEEDTYAVPSSNRKADNQQEHVQMTENIYDVPSLLKKMSTQSFDSLSIKEGSLLEDMVSGFGGESADPATYASESEDHMYI